MGRHPPRGVRYAPIVALVALLFAAAATLAILASLRMRPRFAEASGALALASGLSPYLAGARADAPAMYVFVDLVLVLMLATLLAWLAARLRQETGAA